MEGSKNHQTYANNYVFSVHSLRGLMDAKVYMYPTRKSGNSRKRVPTWEFSNGCNSFYGSALQFAPGLKCRDLKRQIEDTLSAPSETFSDGTGIRCAPRFDRKKKNCFYRDFCARLASSRVQTLDGRLMIIIGGQKVTKNMIGGIFLEIYDCSVALIT